MSSSLPIPNRHLPRRDWISQAACKGKPSDWWYPEYPFTKSRRVRAAKAKEICGTCPVADQCLEYALKWELDGIWGGKSVDERNRLRRSRGIRLRKLMTDV